MTATSTRTTRSNAAADAVVDQASVETSTENATGLPNLKGLVTKEMVKTIGTGRYSAEYCPWSKIAELLNEHAPGWQPELINTPEGGILHQAPVGGYLLIRFRNILTGAVTTEWVQSVMDSRHNSIPHEKITSRDISDTSRRGFCLAAAAVFNLGIELWTRDPIESGYARVLEEQDATSETVLTKSSATPAAATAATAQSTTKEQFLQAAIDKGLTTYAAESLAGKLNGNYAGGITRLKEKDAAWVTELNAASAPKEESPTVDGKNW